MSGLLEAVEVETAAGPSRAVIWMHGLGADGHDFEPLVPELELAPSPAVRFVFPHAPIRAVTINSGMRMRAWYDVFGQGGTRREDEGGVRESQKAIEALIEREKQRGIPAGRIALAGFSQGGAMALQTGLRHPERLAGLLILSSFLPLADQLAAEASPANRAVPIWMAHGTHDPMIPISRARDSRDRLQALGYAVDWHEYRMPHSLCAEEIVEIRAWLWQVLDLG